MRRLWAFEDHLISEAERRKHEGPRWALSKEQQREIRKQFFAWWERYRIWVENGPVHRSR